ncbi:hypothetical protein Esti_006176 [Eimeria stiedai]
MAASTLSMELVLLHEGACSKRKPATQLTKDNVDQLESGREASADADAGQDLKEADPETLKNRRRLKIVRTHGPPANAVGEQQKPGEKEASPKAETTATVPEAKEAPASAAAAAEGVSPTTEAASVTGADESKTGLVAAAAPAAAAAPECTVLNGDAAQNSNSNSSNSTESGGGLFGSVLKGTPAFVSPFGSLGATGSSFLLPSSGNAAGPSLFGGPQGGPQAADAEEAEASPTEEPTIVATTVDSKEEVIFSDRDCRMQCFDAEHKVWTPKPPLDGKVDFVVPKKGEEEGLPIARLLFFVNRTGRLRLNSPVLPSSVRFRHPVERAAAKPVAAGAAAAGPDTEASAKEKNDVPLKLNTVEFTGLKIDAEDSKDTTFYRIRFSSDERAKEFMTLANAKQEEATKAAQNGSK